jgi:ribosomal protein L37AE/L43A
MCHQGPEGGQDAARLGYCEEPAVNEANANLRGPIFAMIKSERNCPRCGQGSPPRLRRKVWMRLLPASRYYKCDRCSLKFLAAAIWTVRFH